MQIEGCRQLPLVARKSRKWGEERGCRELPLPLRNFENGQVEDMVCANTTCLKMAETGGCEGLPGVAVSGQK
jgi:hypothetical protein